MTTKHYRIKEEISLFSIKERNYKSDIKNNIDLNKANNKYLL